jgi:hypothetical protein
MLWLCDCVEDVSNTDCGFVTILELSVAEAVIFMTFEAVSNKGCCFVSVLKLSVTQAVVL